MHITKAKKDAIRAYFIAGQPNVRYLAERLELRQATIRFYINEFLVLQKERPDRLDDFSFFIGKDKVTQATAWYRNFVRVMPAIVAAEQGPLLIAERLYQRYRLQCPDEYSKPRFYHLFRRWFDEHEKELCAARLKAKFTPKELETLRKWRKSNDRRLWQVAVALMTVYTYNSMGKLAARIEYTHKTLLDWLRTFEAKGLDALSRPGSKKPLSADRKAQIERKMDDIVHMVRQSPRTYGIDKASWTITDLAYAYGKLSGKAISLDVSEICYTLFRGKTDHLFAGKEMQPML